MTSKATLYKQDKKSNNFREIRSIHAKDTIRLYQAYNDQIANAAVQANSFQAPLQSGLWSKNRMTWIKPSKVWMAYRCGWTVLKDKNQSRVLALDLSRSYFESLLEQATITHPGSSSNGKNKKKKKCRDCDVVVQWDPERIMDVNAHGKQSFTTPVPSMRSIQIGLRNSAVDLLLDEKFVLRITDVTQDFRNALKALKAGDMEAAESCLFPDCNLGKECVMDVPCEIRKILCMDDDDDDDDDDNNNSSTSSNRKRKRLMRLCAVSCMCLKFYSFAAYVALCFIDRRTTATALDNADDSAATVENGCIPKKNYSPPSSLLSDAMLLKGVERSRMCVSTVSTFTATNVDRVFKSVNEYMAGKSVKAILSFQEEILL